MISLWGEFYVCLACTTVMVHNWSTRDSHEDFCHKSSVFKREAKAFFKHPLWHTFVMNVLLDKQEWCSKDGSAIAARLPRLRMLEMPIPSSRCLVRATGVPSNVSGNRSLHQSTLTQPAKSPPAAAAAPKRKNRTSTVDVESDDYTDSLSKDPNYEDGKLAAQKQPKKSPRTSFEDSVTEIVQKSQRLSSALPQSSSALSQSSLQSPAKKRGPSRPRKNVDVDAQPKSGPRSRNSSHKPPANCIIPASVNAPITEHLCWCNKKPCNNYLGGAGITSFCYFFVEIHSTYGHVLY